MCRRAVALGDRWDSNSQQIPTLLFMCRRSASVCRTKLVLGSGLKFWVMVLGYGFGSGLWLFWVMVLGLGYGFGSGLGLGLGLGLWLNSYRGCMVPNFFYRGFLLKGHTWPNVLDSFCFFSHAWPQNAKKRKETQPRVV